jgi:hypothetical protein
MGTESSGRVMKNLLLAVTALAEAGTGLALMLVPALVGRWLLGTELAGAAVPVARVAGIALLALGIACWPGATALCGMLTYGLLVTLYLGWLAVGGQWAGPLLWPAVVLHAILTLLLGGMWLKARKVGVR